MVALFYVGGFAPMGSRDLVPKFGDRIAQLVISPVARAHIVEAEELTETARGASGFGSSGR